MRRKIFDIDYKKSAALATLVLIFASCKHESDFYYTGKPEVILVATDPRMQADQIKLSNDTVYILSSNLTRTSGQSLSIEEGTIIKVRDKISITIEEGGMIDAVGSSQAPIVFTSSAAVGSAGYLGPNVSTAHFWNGIHIHGSSLSNGISSGKLEFVRIEFAGGNPDQIGLPSLLLDNVTATSLNNIQVSYSYAANSFEFRGGTVDASNLISYAAICTDFYFSNGYKGKLQHLIAYRHPYFPASITAPGAPLYDALAGVYVDGSATAPTISNLTVLGPNLQLGTGFFYFNAPPSQVAAVVINGDCKLKLRNSVLMGFPKTAFYVNDRPSAVSLDQHESEVYYSIFHSNDTSTLFYLSPELLPINSKDLATFLTRPELMNEIFNSSEMFQFQDPFNYDSPNLLLKSSSPLNMRANFTGDFDDTFFQKVSYRGAIGDIDWISGWTNFQAGRTLYNP